MTSRRRNLGQRLASANSPSPSWSDGRLVDACLEGDAEAWSALIAKYKNLIYSIPIKYGAAPEDASDIFQAVCVELYEGLAHLQRVDSLPAWLCTVARHQSFHWKRRRVKRLEREGVEIAEVEGAWLGRNDPDVMEEAQREQLVRQALAAVPDRCQALLRLLFFEQPPRPYAEIAAELGLATGSIGFIRGRCLQKLQRELARHGVSP